MLEEWDSGGTLTEDEKRTVEDEVNKCLYEELKEENEKLKDEVEEVTRRAEEEVKKRVKAEEEVKREKAMVDNLMKILLDKSSMVKEVRKEETVGRRAESRSLDRPRLCYPGEGAVVREEAGGQQQGQGFQRPPAMVRGERGIMVGGQQVQLGGQPLWGGRQPLWGALQPLWWGQQHMWWGQQPVVGYHPVYQQPMYRHQHSLGLVHQRAMVHQQ